MKNAKVTLVDGMKFSAIAGSGHTVVMDADPKSGGRDKGSRPIELLLMAFGGCSGMDVISVLRKKKEKVSKLEINVNGKQADSYPHKYTSIHIEYVVTGKDISDDAVKKAIELSLDKYCAVGASLSGTANITHSYKIISE